MDVLYYIGGGSRLNNDELRFSLRSLEKHCKDVDRVWIVGNKPAFLKNVEYLWVEDKYKWYTNAFMKTKAAIDAGISDEFLLMNDDFFMLDDFTAKDYPYYHRGDMPATPINDYQKIIVNTRNFLASIDKPIKHYGVHCPIRIKGELYNKLENYFFEPYSPRCLYGNLFCHGERVPDCKNKDFQSGNPTKCFSSSDMSQRETINALAIMFPKPSKWENEDV